MAHTVFLFADTSSDIGLPGMGGGWVAACDGIIAYGNADCPEDGDHSRRILLDRAFDFATRRFPDADEILITGPKDDVIRLPWGEAMDDDALVALDRTGIGSYCAARDIRLTARWLAGNLPGTGADMFALGVARVLAAQARRGVELWGEIVHEAGWRSQLVSLFGGAAFNHGIDGKGMSPAQVAEFAGIEVDAVAGMVRPGWLTLTPEGRITYATAIRIRDGLEADGTTRWDEDDFGDAYLDVQSEPADATICIDYAASSRGMGIGIAIRHGTHLGAWAKRYSPVMDQSRSAGLRAALSALAFRLRDLEGCKVIDVVTGDAWLAKILWGVDDDRQPVIDATEALRATVRELGVVIRPRHIFMPYARAEAPGELHGLARSSCIMAHVGAAGTSACHEASAVLGADGLLSLCEAQASALRSDLARQEEVIRSLLDNCGVELNVREIFEGLVAATVESYRGVIVDLHPFLPGPARGQVAVMTPAGPKPLGSDFGLTPQMASRWYHWHLRYGRVRERNPVVRLRERLLDVDRTIDLTKWDLRRYRSLMAWIDAWQAHTPFTLAPSVRIQVEAEIRGLVEECGGWPWGEPGGGRALLRPSTRKPVAAVARPGRAALVEYVTAGSD